MAVRSRRRQTREPEEGREEEHSRSCGVLEEAQVGVQSQCHAGLVAADQEVAREYCPSALEEVREAERIHLFGDQEVGLAEERSRSLDDLVAGLAEEVHNHHPVCFVVAAAALEEARSHSHCGVPGEDLEGEHDIHY